MTREIMDKVLRRFIVVYGEPKDVEPRELFAEFFKALDGYRADILAKAADRVIKERAFPTWPTVGEVVKACRECAEEMADRFVREPVREERKYEPVDHETAKQLLAQAHAAMDQRNSFDAIMARARSWSRHNMCKVYVAMAAPCGSEVTDEFGRVVPIGWKRGDVA